jgi:peptidoglycan/xylan/chitin deacetylase (PgdA/CDA1 family)
MRALRTKVKRALIAFAREVPGAWTSSDWSRRVVVLCYHSIHPTKSFASATPAAFGNHLDWLVERCAVVPLADIPAAMRTSERNRPAVAITFDDGYRDNYEFAFPELDSRRLPATFFLTAGLLDNDPAVVERQQRLRRSTRADVCPLAWEEVRVMQTAGMEIGAHTYTHPNLAGLSRGQVRDELQRSKDIIEERLGRRIRSMAYPFGKPRRHFTAETMSLVEEVGYEYACAVLFRDVRPSDSRVAIPRLVISGDALPVLSEKVLGAWDVIGMWQEHCPLWAARLLSPRDFGQWV